MPAWSFVGRGALFVSLAVPAAVAAQTPAAPPVPAARISMADAVRLALEHNHQLRAQRLNVDLSKADEITAALKPNPVLTSTNENFPLFAPSQLFNSDNFLNNQNFVESVTYLFERGGKRRNRTVVAQDTTDVAAKTAFDAERQLRFSTEQAFINVLLAKSSLDLAQEDLKNFSNVVEVNKERLRAGDLAEADFYKISLQKLQFEQDVASAEVALVQAKAALRQNVGFDVLAEQFDVDGDLTYTKQTVTLDDVMRDALATRPDLLAAQSGVKLAQDTQSLAYSNRARDVVGGVEYDRAGPLNAVGFSLSVDLPFHDRNQGNIAHSKVAVTQSQEVEAQAVSTVQTDVVTAFATMQANERVLALYQSGYLDQAKQSLDITTYVYQHGNGTLLDLLDAERTYRGTQLAYRQALAAYMTSVQQVNLVVGKQVVQ
ncbi:MAG TPA: TolC family protein [Vicinamibacterales bacterium]|jgi:cobalt-zinc-cadmium efflux system outer membrane protein|nr:TolC family protein [Vicinamibacterales bacterium]